MVDSCVFSGYPLLSHGGNLPGYQSYMTLLPVRRVGVSTSFVGASGAKAYAAKILINIFALDILLNGQPWVADGDICSTMEKMVRLARQYPLNVPPYKKSFASRGHLLNFEGAYENMIFGTVMIATNYSSGLLHLHYGQANYVLQPTNENYTFIMEAVPGPLWFQTHADEYTQQGPAYAIFNRTRDDSARMNTIKLPSFDKDIEPIFLRKSSNPILDAISPSAAASEYEDLEDDVDEKVDDFYCSSDSQPLTSFVSMMLTALSLYIIMT